MRRHRTTTRRGSVLAAVLATGPLLLASGCSDAGTVVQAPPADATAATSADSSTAGPSGSAGSATPSATPSTSTAPPVAYQAGDCTTKEPDWKVVPCAADHQYEVTGVGQNDQYPTDLLKRYNLRVASCDRQTGSYLGSDSWSATHYRTVTLPTAVDSAAASRFVCLVGRFDASFNTVLTSKTSEKGKLKGDGVYASRACVVPRVSAGGSFAPVSCSTKHASEAVGAGYVGTPEEAYPGDAELQKRAKALCLPQVQAFLGTKTDRDDITNGTSVPGAVGWSQGRRSAQCFVEATSGTLSKSLKDIGAKPLTGYR